MFNRNRSIYDNNIYTNAPTTHYNEQSKKYIGLALKILVFILLLLIGKNMFFHSSSSKANSYYKQTNDLLMQTSKDLSITGESISLDGDTDSFLRYIKSNLQAVEDLFAR